MATAGRLEHDDTGWAFTEAAMRPLAAELRQQIEFTDTEMTASGHANVANRWRNVYMEEGRLHQRDMSLRHYAVALSGDKSRLFQSWVLCHRLNLYLYDYQNGRLPVEAVTEQLDLATDRIPGALTVRERKFRTYTLDWLNSTRARLYETPAGEAPTEDTQAMPVPIVSGRIAVERAILEPDAA